MFFIDSHGKVYRALNRAESAAIAEGKGGIYAPADLLAFGPTGVSVEAWYPVVVTKANRRLGDVRTVRPGAGCNAPVAVPQGLGWGLP